MGKFELFTGSDAKVYFRLRAGNGEIVAQSEGYSTRDGAKRGVATLVALVLLELPIEDLTE